MTKMTKPLLLSTNTIVGFHFSYYSADHSRLEQVPRKSPEEPLERLLVSDNLQADALPATQPTVSSNCTRY